MAEMTVFINSRPFQVVCADGKEAQVSQLAEDLAVRVARLKEGNEKIGDSHLLVLSALTLCNELRDMKHEIEAIRQDVAKASAARETLGGKMDDMEAVLSAALVLAAEKVEAMLPPLETPASETPKA